MMIGMAQEMENKVSPPPMSIVMYEEPTDKQWEILQKIDFPFHLHLCFLEPFPEKSATLDKLKNLSTLHFLEVTGDSINDGILECVKDLPSLEHVRFQHCDSLTDQGMQSVAELKKLKNLEVINCSNISSTSFHIFHQHPLLESLHIEGCMGVTNQIISELFQIPKLRKLSLVCNHHCTFTEENYEQFAKLNDLEILSLSPCENLTRQNVFRILQKLPNLRLLYMERCPEITAEDRKELQKKFPDVMIVIDE